MADESDPTPADDAPAADEDGTTDADPTTDVDGTGDEEPTTDVDGTGDEEPTTDVDGVGDEESTTEASYAPALSVDQAVEALESVGREPVGEGGATGEAASAAAELVGEALEAALSDAAAGAEALARAAEGASGAAAAPAGVDPSIPADVRAYDRFSKMDRSSYDRVNEFLRDRTYVTAREWAIARLCADFRTATGVEMTKIGQHLPELVPFMTDTYTPQAVNQARSAFEGKVRKSGATFLYGAMSGFFTADELDDVMYEVTEVAKFLLEVEGVDLTVDEELAAEERISSVMRDVRRASEQLRHEGVECPECGNHITLTGVHVDEQSGQGR